MHLAIPPLHEMTTSLDETSDEEQPLDLFREPDGYYAPEKPPTSASYKCRDGTVLDLRLIGHSPLWGHLLWNAGQIVATYIEDHATDLVKGKTVLELGAGAGLPSLVSAIFGASKVVVTDYPELELIQNLRHNIEHCHALSDKSTVVVEGFLWGSSVASLKAHLPLGSAGFDLLILADILFNHSEHAKLVRTVQEALSKDNKARALVFFTPYRPWLLENDLNFFELAKEAGLHVTKILEHIMEKVMFENDRGDEKLRRTVFGYEVRLNEDK